MPAFPIWASYRNRVRAFAPIAYWPLSDASGSTATDASGNGRDSSYSNVTLGAAGIGDGNTAATFNGSTSYANIYTAGLAGAFNGQELTMLCWIKVSAAGVWTDGAARHMFQLQADANNRIRIRKSAVNNTLNFWYNAGGTFSDVTVAGQSSIGWLALAVTASKTANEWKAYINGAQVGSTQTGLGTFTGSLSTVACLIGAGDTTPTLQWSGSEAHCAVWSSALTAAQIASLSSV